MKTWRCPPWFCFHVFVSSLIISQAGAVYNRDMTTVLLCEDKSEWDNEIIDRGGHPLQLWGWGETKATHNWRVERVFVKEGGAIIGAAQLLLRQLPKPFISLTYIPRGPVAEEGDRRVVLDALAKYVKAAHGGVSLTIEPDWVSMPTDVLGWKSSKNTILIPQTLILDLTESEDSLLAKMTKKTRQYIRKSAGEAIEIHQVKGREELDQCLDIYEDTARRAGFRIHSRQYYHDVFDNLGEHSPVFAVFLSGKPIAFLWLAVSSRTSFELYGGMNDTGQQLRANYALKWHAIQTTKRWGIERYDFNGLLNDGVSTFKRGFASHEDTLAGTYDMPLSPLYVLWSKGLPAAKNLVRIVKNR